MGAQRFEQEGFSASIEPMGAFLRAHVFGGRDSLEVSIAMWRFLAAQCEHHGMRKLLVVEDLDASLDLAEAEQLVDAVIDLGFRGMQVAFVDLQPKSGAGEHGEILAVERGVSARVFAQEAVARRWLALGDTPHDAGSHAAAPAAAGSS